MRRHSNLSYLHPVRSALAELNLPETLTFDGLQKVVARRRSRKLVVRRTAELRGTPVCAMTYSNVVKDLILYAPAEERRRERHFICHEFGHLLLGHHEQARSNVMRPLPLLAPSMVADQLKMAEINPGGKQKFAPSGWTPASRRSAACSTFTSVEEKRAERFADLLMEHLWLSSLRRLDEPVRFAEVFG